MNAARSDKERMLDHVRPGRIVEVGPGGGVVLDLLEDRFPGSEVIGIDASAEVCTALAARRARDRRRWRIVHADAFALPELFAPVDAGPSPTDRRDDPLLIGHAQHQAPQGQEALPRRPDHSQAPGPGSADDRRREAPQAHGVALGHDLLLTDRRPAAAVDTVVCCSVLHEIYSYVERPGDDGSPPRRFRLESVRDLLRAAWRALRPGGRLVIRDGVAPTKAIRRLAFVEPGSRDVFDLFVAQFEGRPIVYRDLPGGRVELSAADAMEFLYTFTWGPESFPYEVREQYGVLTYADYRAHLVAWLDGARLVPLPPEIASYLQPGYEAGLAGRIELTDEHDRPARLPDSNCLLVVEKS